MVPATYYGLSGDYPLELLLTVTFDDQDGKTKFTLHHLGHPPGPDIQMAREGWSQSLDKLAELLAGIS
ncbi:MAG: SRPBCC domain-containing protein [Candidatus Aminicenantes bacterium]|nr:SRPBCC domain-containing protein [Candidatus Aminicenantes bacterium]